MTLKEAGIDIGMAIAGLFGAVLMSSKSSAQNTGRTIISLVGGAASANYVTPLILHVTHLDSDPSYTYSIAFLLGFAGLRAIEVISSRFLDVKPTQNEPTHINKRRR